MPSEVYFYVTTCVQFRHPEAQTQYLSYHGWYFVQSTMLHVILDLTQMHNTIYKMYHFCHKCVPQLIVRQNYIDVQLQGLLVMKYHKSSIRFYTKFNTCHSTFLHTFAGYF